MSDDMGNEEDENTSGGDASVMIFAAALLAFLNIVFYRQIQDYVNPAGRGPYTVFFGVNTFLYIWLVQTLSASVTLSVFPSAVLSGLCGYAIALMLLPDKLEEKETLEVPTDLEEKQKEFQEEVPLDESKQEDGREEGSERSEKEEDEQETNDSDLDLQQKRRDSCSEDEQLQPSHRDHGGDPVQDQHGENGKGLKQGVGQTHEDAAEKTSLEQRHNEYPSDGNEPTWEDPKQQDGEIDDVFDSERPKIQEEVIQQEDRTEAESCPQEEQGAITARSEDEPGSNAVGLSGVGDEVQEELIKQEERLGAESSPQEESAAIEEQSKDEPGSNAVGYGEVRDEVTEEDGPENVSDIPQGTSHEEDPLTLKRPQNRKEEDESNPELRMTEEELVPQEEQVAFADRQIQDENGPGEYVSETGENEGFEHENGKDVELLQEQSESCSDSEDERPQQSQREDDGGPLREQNGEGEEGLLEQGLGQTHEDTAVRTPLGQQHDEYTSDGDVPTWGDRKQQDGKIDDVFDSGRPKIQEDLIQQEDRLEAESSPQEEQGAIPGWSEDEPGSNAVGLSGVGDEVQEELIKQEERLGAESSPQEASAAIQEQSKDEPGSNAVGYGEVADDVTKEDGPENVSDIPQGTTHEEDPLTLERQQNRKEEDESDPELRMTEEELVPQEEQVAFADRRMQDENGPGEYVSGTGENEGFEQENGKDVELLQEQSESCSDSEDERPQQSQREDDGEPLREQNGEGEEGLLEQGLGQTHEDTAVRTPLEQQHDEYTSDGDVPTWGDRKQQNGKIDDVFDTGRPKIQEDLIQQEDRLEAESSPQEEQAVIQRQNKDEPSSNAVGFGKVSDEVTKEDDSEDDTDELKGMTYEQDPPILEMEQNREEEVELNSELATTRKEPISQEEPATAGGQIKDKNWQEEHDTTRGDGQDENVNREDNPESIKPVETTDKEDPVNTEERQEQKQEHGEDLEPSEIREELVEHEDRSDEESSPHKDQVTAQDQSSEEMAPGRQVAGLENDQAEVITRGSRPEEESVMPQELPNETDPRGEGQDKEAPEEALDLLEQLATSEHLPDDENAIEEEFRQGEHQVPISKKPDEEKGLTEDRDSTDQEVGPDEIPDKTSRSPDEAELLMLEDMMNQPDPSGLDSGIEKEVRGDEQRAAPPSKQHYDEWLQEDIPLDGHSVTEDAVTKVKQPQVESSITQDIANGEECSIPQEQRTNHDGLAQDNSDVPKSKDPMVNADKPDGESNDGTDFTNGVQSSTPDGRPEDKHLAVEEEQDKQSLMADNDIKTDDKREDKTRTEPMSDEEGVIPQLGEQDDEGSTDVVLDQELDVQVNSSEEIPETTEDISKEDMNNGVGVEQITAPEQVGDGSNQSEPLDGMVDGSEEFTDDEPRETVKEPNVEQEATVEEERLVVQDEEPDFAPKESRRAGDLVTHPEVYDEAFHSKELVAGQDEEQDELLEHDARPDIESMAREFTRDEPQEHGQVGDDVFLEKHQRFNEQNGRDYVPVGSVDIDNTPGDQIYLEQEFSHGGKEGKPDDSQEEEQAPTQNESQDANREEAKRKDEMVEPAEALEDVIMDDSRPDEESMPPAEKMVEHVNQVEELETTPDQGHEDALLDVHQEYLEVVEVDPFEKVLHQLGLNKDSRLGLLDQRTVKVADSKEKADQDIPSDFFLNLSVGMPDATANLLASHRRQAEDDGEHDVGVLEENQRNIEEPEFPEILSRRDALFAILSCCDPFLLQEIMRQLVVCDSAVPVVMPTRDSEPVFLLWGSRKAKIPRVSSPSSLVSSADVATTPFVTVSAIRLGESSVSKSEIFNNMLATLKCSDECHPFIVEEETSVWSSGTVEAAWYLPSSDKADSEVPLALLNLRGDSKDHPKQAKLCAGAAKFLLVFADSMEADDDDDDRDILQHISPDTHIIVVSQTADMEPSFANSGDISSIDARNCSPEQISHSVLEVIRGRKVPEAERESLEVLSELCKDLEIPVDEEVPECREAKITAAAINEELRGKSKDEIFPLQTLWKQLVEVNNEKLGEQNIEHELSETLEKKKGIRSAQSDSELSAPMEMFVRSLDTDSEQKRYTNTWLEIMLEKPGVVPDLAAVAPGADEESDRGDGAEKVDHLDITDFHKELGQLAESGHPCLRQDNDKGDRSIFEYFLELQRNGVPLVVFDSDAGAVPLDSLEETLNHLDASSESEPKVCVVSVIGSPKSFKTTLLNRLFGVNFSTRGQVTTKGMLLQLVPVKQPASEQIGCDYLLIIDTQSFDRADNPSLEDMERHEYITTLALCISDLVLVNTRLSQRNDNQDARVIDPIFTRGLNKMKEVNKSGKCCLVQHYDKDIVPIADEGTLSEKLFQKAKQDLSEEIARGQVKGASEDMFDVFTLDEQSLVMSIPYEVSDQQLGPSEESCQQVISLKDLMLQVTSECSRAQMSFGDFGQRIADVTDALKHQEYLEVVEVDPFEKVLHQLGLNKDSRLGLLDQRTVKVADSKEKADQDIPSDFFLNLSVGMPDATANLLASHRRQAEEDGEHDVGVLEENQRNVEEPEFPEILSRRDALFAILSCCDPFLLQEIMRQLVVCDSAVPVVMPTRDSEPVFVLWGSRKAKIPRVSSPSSLVSSADVATTPFVTVSAIRLGESSVSKSEIFNNILATLKCSDKCHPFIVEEETSVWSSGTVEAAWYLPSSDKADSEVPLALLNLRGDSMDHPKQAKLCAGAAKFLLVFADSMEADDDRDILQHISPDTHIIVVSQTADMEPFFANSGDISSIDARNCSPERISHSVLEVIRGRKVPEAERESLEVLSELCKDLEIPVDEEVPECREAKITAAAINEELRGKSKDEIFPLQTLWKQLVEVNNEKLGEQNIEHELSEILEKKKGIRSAQSDSELSAPMEMFVRSLDTDSEQKRYTNTWLEIMLEKPGVVLDLAAVAPGADEESDRGDGAEKVDHLDITDFHKELGQLAESGHPCLRQDNDNGDRSIFEYFLELQRNGVPLVVFDSDAGAVPLDSLEDTLNHLDASSESEPKVCVMSVIGSPKSFKTTLLNRLFGVNFSTRGQVTTKGMLLQLVPVKQPASEQIGCDYLLIIDTQSFDLADNPSPEDMERHEYITTLALCISDLVLVNTRLSQRNDNQDARVIDPIFTRGLNKMKEVNKSGKCCLIQHYDKDIVPIADEETLSEKLFQEAKQDLSEEIARGQVKGASEDMFDVFTLDEQSLVMSIPYEVSDLQLGPSEGSCQQVISLKDLMLQVTSECSRAQMSFGDFGQRIADVTDALKQEEFVKDFRDTNVENLKDEFVVWYRDLLLKVKSDLNVELASSCNKLGKVPTEELPEARNAATSQLTQTVEEGFDNVKEQIQEQLQTRKYECLADQEEYFKQDINAARDSFLPKIGESFNRVVRNAEQIRKLTKGIQKEGGAFLATLPANVQPDTTDEEVQEEYERKQSEFVIRLHRKYPLHKIDVIHKNTEDNMLYMLKQCGDDVAALVATESLATYVDDQGQMSSIDDAKRLKDGFNVSSSAAEEAFEIVKSKLFALRENPVSFKDSSKEFTELLKSHEADFQPLVENVIMHLFIMGKFVSEMHESHLEKEIEELKGAGRDDADDQTKVQDIERDVNSDGYKITRAEPLDLPTVDAKISAILSELKKDCTEPEMVILEEVFTSKNIQNCASLPFDLVTMQRLDRCFLSMLPVLHSEDMNSISNAVNDAKMIMFGKVYAKQRFDHGKTFNDIYSLVQKTIIDDKEQGKKVRAAALVHLSAWSTAVADVKKLEDLRTDNVANTFEREQGKICLALFKSRSGHNCDDVIADIICDEIEHSLGGLATDSIVTRLREFFLLEAGVFNLKRTFIGTVLRDLCLKDDYLGFASFLKNYNEFGEKWILNYLANECNKDDDSLLGRLMKEVIDSQMDAIERVIKETTAECETSTSPNLSNWLQIFQAKFSDQFNTSCRANTMEILDTETSVEKFSDFNARLIQSLDGMRPRLEGSLSLPILGNGGDTKAWLLSLSHEIHVELAAVVRGCIEQCPFCGAACESTLGEHEYHETVLHYPGGVKGWHDVKTLKLFTDICTSAVASSQQYRTPQEEFRPYKEYKLDHPRWEIPGKIGEPMEFWQFVFNKFNAQFARHYSCQNGDVPSQWSRITKEEAVRSVEKAYKLNQVAIDA